MEDSEESFLISIEIKGVELIGDQLSYSIIVSDEDTTAFVDKIEATCFAAPIVFLVTQSALTGARLRHTISQARGQGVRGSLRIHGWHSPLL